MKADKPRQIGLAAWDARYRALQSAGHTQPAYGGPLRRHLADGDLRLRSLRYDNSAVALDLWNFLLTEEARLHAARASGKIIVGAMKDLGTVPVMAYALPNVVAFYPDGAWWIPCVMALADPMVGSAQERAERICREVVRFGAQAVVISRIPGASHCASEGIVIAEQVRQKLGLPVVEIEVPPIMDPLRETLRTRLAALVETVKGSQPS